MTLLPGWQERLAEAKSIGEKKPYVAPLPKAPSYYAQDVTFIASVEQAENLFDFAQQRPLSHIGFDTEFQYSTPGVLIRKGQVAYDPTSIRPLVLSVALVEPRQGEESILYPFVVDLRNRDLHPVLTQVLRLPVCFVGHFSKVELFCLWQLGLPEPTQLWDTWVCEKALALGLANAHYKLPRGADDVDEAIAKAEKEEDEDFSLSLVETCQRYGYAHAMAGAKTRLQESFMDHSEGEPFTHEQIQYAAEDAIAAGRLYHHQTSAASQAGILEHLVTIEMPWVRTNTHMQWYGVKVDSNKCDQVREACGRYLPAVEKRLSEYGIANVRSHPQLKHFFTRRGLLALFRKKGNYSFDKKQLKRFKDRHPAIPVILEAKRIHSLHSDKILTGEFVGVDGRIHPEHRQLGADTGRQTSRSPNILGLDSTLRPLVVPEKGCGIGEVDLSQIEVGIAAAVYGDQKLIEMFNSDDVYAAMAKYYYRDELSDQDRSLNSREFKDRYPERRDRMKTCTLGILYGLTSHGIAQQLDAELSTAETLRTRFFEMFPQLKERMRTARDFGAIRGYAQTCTGLRRNRPRKGMPSNWEKNWLTNHPVQGSAAAVFKAAGNRLDRLYSQYDAWLIIPLHDAYIFEAPLAVLSEVAALTDRVMRGTVQEYFPQLRPRTEINLIHPECWNKEGDAGALARWVANAPGEPA